MKLVCFSGNIPSGDGTEIGQGFSTQIHGGLDQLPRCIFRGEHIHVGDVNFHGMGTSSAAVYAGTTQSAATTQVAAPREGDEGLFLSNLLRQIMPIISESTASGSSIPSSEGRVILRIELHKHPQHKLRTTQTEGPRQVVDMAIHHPLQAPNVKG
ncbi:ubiquitin-like domain-containing protein CIP73 [Camellia sinensis]|uniref:ubiquitin-like domain-containing protein CIP73 n=1 Tax=Camellia sinensis TaxID=4442 RepID=UPI001035D27E|nr:ubiquitin-like domain-containing protein CIP73 [Camellia sinensis]